MTNAPYPIRLDPELSNIPRSMILAHDAQCEHNHGHSLEYRESKYGGLTPEEAVAILEDREYARMSILGARRRLLQLVVEFHAKHSFSAMEMILAHLDSATNRAERMRDGHTPVHRGTFNLLLGDLVLLREMLT
jgi:hypothetical protein